MSEATRSHYTPLGVPAGPALSDAKRGGGLSVVLLVKEKLASSSYNILSFCP